MNNKRIFLLLLLAFVLILSGAYVLYTQLSDQFQMPQLSTDGLSSQADTTSKPTAPSNSPSSASNATTDATKPSSEPTPAPNFTVFDKDGNQVQLSDFWGKPIVLNFWASWCGPCKSEMPEFQSMYEELDGKVQFLMVNMTDGSSETVETATKFIDNNSYTFPVFYDTQQQAANTYRVYSLPTTYFIDADGNLIAYAAGAINMEALEYGISMIYP